MFVSMKQLARFFEPLEAVTDDTTPMVEVKYVYHWDGTLSEEAGPVYVITASTLNQVKEFDESREFVFVVQENEPVSEDISKRRNVHIIRIPAKYDRVDISNRTNYLFYNSYNSLAQYDQVLSTIAKPDDFYKVAETISNLTDCPVALIAGTRQVLSSSPHDLKEEEWSGHLSGKLMKTTRIPDKLNYEQFYIEPLTSPIGDYEYEVIFPITSDDNIHRVIGMIYLLCSDPIVPASFSNLLQFSAFAMSWLFTRYANKDNAVRLSNQRMTFMLSDLLHGIIPTEETFKQVLGELSFNTERELVLICIRVSTAVGKDKNTFEQAQKTFMEFFEDSFSFTFSADIVLLTPPDWLRPENKSIQKQFTAALKEYGCYAGISSTFFSVDKYFIHHFSRALASADIAAHLKEERRWTDFRAVPLLAVFSNNYASTSHFCDPALIELVEYDREHESDNLYTLCCYWQLNRDIGRICNFLHIHKNTLYYRLRKIASILRQDINDYDNFIQLSLSISLLEDMGTIPRYRIFDEERLKEKWGSQGDYPAE